MTKAEFEYLTESIRDIMNIVNVNMSLEYMVFVNDNYLSDQEKEKIDIVGLMLHATQNSESIYDKLDNLNLYCFEKSRTPEEIRQIELLRNRKEISDYGKTEEE